MNTDKWIVDGKVELEALKAENAKLWGVLKLIQKMYPQEIEKLLNSLTQIEKETSKTS